LGFLNGGVEPRQTIAGQLSGPGVEADGRGWDQLIHIPIAMIRLFVDRLSVQMKNPRLDVPLGDQVDDGLVISSGVLSESLLQLTNAVGDGFGVGINDDDQGCLGSGGTSPIPLYDRSVVLSNPLLSRTATSVRKRLAINHVRLQSGSVQVPKNEELLARILSEDENLRKISQSPIRPPQPPQP
jgi:hypothetical protein